VENRPGKQEGEEERVGILFSFTFRITPHRIEIEVKKNMHYREKRIEDRPFTGSMP
jgi:hypothetical protein